MQLEKIEEFLKRYKNWFTNEQRVDNKEIIVNLKKEYFTDYHKFNEIRTDANKLGASLSIYPIPGFKIPIYEPVNAPVLINQTKDATVTSPTSFNIPAFHIDRLRTYYSVTNEELAESAFFLLSKGWTEKQFIELGVSRATFFRYQADYKKSQGKTKESHKETS